MRRCLLIVPLLPTLAQAQAPIDTRNHQAASLVFLRFNPRGGLLGTGERSLAFGLTSANNLRFERAFREDQETERLSIRYRQGVARGEWSVELPLLSRGGGFMDPLISGYHDLVGLPNFRKSIPFGRVEERIPGSGSFGSATGIGDVVGTYARPIGPQAFWSVAAKLSTGNAAGLLGSGGLDLGASLDARWKLGPRWSAFGTFALVLQGEPTRLERSRDLVDQESLAVTYRVNSRDSYAFQFQSEPSAVRTGVDFVDGRHSQLSLGYTRRLRGADTLQAFFTEDGDFLNFRVPALVNIAPDFTIGLVYARRW